MSILDEAVRRDLADASVPPPIERVRRRARRQRVRLVGSSLLPVLAIVIVVVIVISSTASHPTERVATATSRPTSATTTLRPSPPAVSARVVFPSRTMRTGSTMAGSVVVKNNTGRPLHVSACHVLYQAALGSATIKPEMGWELCLQHLTIPTGESSYPVTLDAHYPLPCTPDAPHDGELACGPDGRSPKLPPGEYRAIVFPVDADVLPTPPPLTVRVTR